MNLAALAPRQPAAARLQAALASGKLAHAFLVTGAAAEERRELALALAIAINCESGDGATCGECPSCIQASGGNHPDISCWQADGSTFKLAQALDLQAKAWVRPVGGGRKVFIIEDAGLFTPEAANSLLKLIEEPPGDAVFLLLAPSARAVLPTIASRTQPLALQGEMTAATPEAEAAVWDLLSRLPQLNEASLIQIAEAWDRDKGQAREQVQVLFELWRDLLALAVGCPRELLYRPNWEPRLQSLGSRWQVPELVAGLGAIAKGQRYIERNANLRLCLEVIFLSLLPAM